MIKNLNYKGLRDSQPAKIISPGPVMSRLILAELALEKKLFVRQYDPATFSVGCRLILGQKVDHFRAGVDRVTEVDKLEVKSALDQFFGPQGYVVKPPIFKKMEETCGQRGIFRFWEVAVEVS